MFIFRKKDEFKEERVEIDLKTRIEKILNDTTLFLKTTTGIVTSLTLLLGAITSLVVAINKKSPPDTNLSWEKLIENLREIEKDSNEEKALLLELKDRDIYKINDTNLVDALVNKSDFTEEVSEKIRKIWKNSEGPFNYQEKDMIIVIDRTLSDREAKVCRNHSFLANDQRLIVINNSKRFHMVDVNVNRTDSSCNIGEKKLIISTDIATELKIENSFQATVSVDTLFDNPRNAPNL